MLYLYSIVIMSHLSIHICHKLRQIYTRSFVSHVVRCNSPAKSDLSPAQTATHTPQFLHLDSSPSHKHLSQHRQPHKHRISRILYFLRATNSQTPPGTAPYRRDISSNAAPWAVATSIMALIAIRNRSGGGRGGSTTPGLVV